MSGPNRDKRVFVRVSDDEHKRFVDDKNPRVLWKARGFTSFSALVRELLYNEEARKK